MTETPTIRGRKTKEYTAEELLKMQDKKRESARLYYIAHREKILAMNKERSKKEDTKTKNREYYLKNREHIRNLQNARSALMRAQIKAFKEMNIKEIVIEDETKKEINIEEIKEDETKKEIKAE